MKMFLLIFAPGVLSLGGVFAANRPNIIVILADDLGAVREDLTPTLLQNRSPSQFKLQLYNIAEDRNETRDLTEEKPETVARLQKLSDGFLAQSQPTTFTPAVIAANKAAVAARGKNPARREHPRSDGAPGHWIGGGAKKRLAKEQADE